MHRRGPKRMSTPLDELDMELEVLKKKRMMLQQERQLIEERQQLQRMQQQYGSGVWEQPFQNQNIPSLMAAPTTFGGSDNSPFGGYGYDNISASNKRAPRSNRRRGGGPRSEPSRNRPEDNRSGQQPPSRGNPIRKSNDLPPPKRQAQPMSQAASNPPFQTAKKGMSLGIFKPGEISIQAQSRFGNVISTIFREIKAAFESKYDFLPSISAALKDLIRANVHEMMAFKEIVHQNEIIEMYRKCYPLSTDEPLLRKAIEAERKRQPLPKRVKPERQQYTDELKKLIEERKKAREELVMNAKLIQQRVLTHLPKLVDEIVLKFVDPTKPPHDADELDDADVTEIDNEQSEEKPNNDTAENASVQDNAVSDEINAVVDENKAVADEANTGVADVANAVVSDEATAVQDGEFGDAAGDVTASTGIKTNNATNEESDEKEEHTKKKAIEIANMSDNDLANLLRANLVNTMYKARPMLQTMLSKFWRSLVGNSLGDDQGRLVMVTSKPHMPPRITMKKFLKNFNAISLLWRKSKRNMHYWLMEMDTPEEARALVEKERVKFSSNTGSYTFLFKLFEVKDHAEKRGYNIDAPDDKDNSGEFHTLDSVGFEVNESQDTTIDLTEEAETQPDAAAATEGEPTNLMDTQNETANGLEEVPAVAV